MVSAKYATAYESPQGPGDDRPTALQIVEDEGMVGKLSGKVIFVTGASSGLGIETAKALHKTGADIYLGVRDLRRGEQVAKEIKQDNPEGGKVQVIALSLDSLASVRKAATAFLDKSNTLNVLINNAGVMASPEDLSIKDGFDLQFGTNHLGHFLLFQLLKPTLIKSSTPSFQSRVVSLSSLGHRTSPLVFDDLQMEKKPFNTWVAYGQSKTANILFANEIEKRYGSQGLHATSVHPGGIPTNLLRHLDRSLFQQMLDQIPGMKNQTKSAEQGAATTVWAAIGKEWEGKGEKYLEDTSVSKAADPDKTETPANPGYKPWAYDEEAAEKLWQISNRIVGHQG